jgi:hypothetical protein
MTGQEQMTDDEIYIGPPRSEAERDERNPKVRYDGTAGSSDGRSCHAGNAQGPL